ncbi:nitrogen fixation protein NifQ [Undibacterium sp. TJN25]|uniref:nitrogen fixation protein NifQ n=1 Tax=Undibacterium sp. TJN25 TaxID=3413056 RepID=UPI003BF2C18E
MNTSKPANGQPEPAHLALAAVAAVLEHARQGLLPPFAATLGLNYRAYADMLSQYPALLRAYTAIPEHDCAAIASTGPELFREMVQLLLDNCIAGGMQTEWLARAIAAAGFGSRHLWQDLGMSGRSDVSALLRLFFPALYAGNVHNYKWKKFLFAELGRRHGMSGLRPPKCNGCDQFPVCFPEENEGEVSGPAAGQYLRQL